MVGQALDFGGVDGALVFIGTACGMLTADANVLNLARVARLRACGADLAARSRVGRSRGGGRDHGLRRAPAGRNAGAARVVGPGTALLPGRAARHPSAVPQGRVYLHAERDPARARALPGCAGRPHRRARRRRGRRARDHDADQAAARQARVQHRALRIRGGRRRGDLPRARAGERGRAHRSDERRRDRRCPPADASRRDPRSVGDRHLRGSSGRARGRRGARDRPARRGGQHEPRARERRAHLERSCPGVPHPPARRRALPRLPCVRVGTPATRRARVPLRDRPHAARLGGVRVCAHRSPLAGSERLPRRDRGRDAGAERDRRQRLPHGPRPRRRPRGHAQPRRGQ